jgi:hypothetical protein
MRTKIPLLGPIEEDDDDVREELERAFLRTKRPTLAEQEEEPE